MRTFNIYRVLAPVNTIVVFCLYLLFMLMSGLSYHNPEDMVTDSIILLFVHGVLIASIVGGWNLTHAQTNTRGRIVNWLCMLLPWISLALWIAGDYLYYQYIWPYYLYA